MSNVFVCSMKSSGNSSLIVRGEKAWLSRAFSAVQFRSTAKVMNLFFGIIKIKEQQYGRCVDPQIMSFSTDDLEAKHGLIVPNMPRIHFN